jgi:hypothetical protein
MPSPNECPLGAVERERHWRCIRLHFASLRDSNHITLARSLARLGRHGSSVFILPCMQSFRPALSSVLTSHDLPLACRHAQLPTSTPSVRASSS